MGRHRQRRHRKRNRAILPLTHLQHLFKEEQYEIQQNITCNCHCGSRHRIYRLQHVRQIQDARGFRPRTGICQSHRSANRLNRIRQPQVAGSIHRPCPHRPHLPGAGQQQRPQKRQAERGHCPRSAPRCQTLIPAVTRPRTQRRQSQLRRQLVCLVIPDSPRSKLGDRHLRQNSQQQARSKSRLRNEQRLPPGSALADNRSRGKHLLRTCSP